MANCTLLGLDHNNIGDVGMEAFASACASGALPQVENLFLHQNHIGDAGLEALAKAAASGALTSSMTFIDLDNNEASEVGKKAMYDVAKARGLDVYLA